MGNISNERVGRVEKVQGQLEQGGSPEQGLTRGLRRTLQTVLAVGVLSLGQACADDQYQGTDSASETGENESMMPETPLLDSNEFELDPDTGGTEVSGLVPLMEEMGGVPTLELRGPDGKWNPVGSYFIHPSMDNQGRFSFNVSELGAYEIRAVNDLQEHVMISPTAEFSVVEMMVGDGDGDGDTETTGDGDGDGDGDTETGGDGDGDGDTGTETGGDGDGDSETGGDGDGDGDGETGTDTGMENPPEVFGLDQSAIDCVEAEGDCYIFSSSSHQVVFQTEFVDSFAVIYDNGNGGQGPQEIASGDVQNGVVSFGLNTLGAGPQTSHLTVILTGPNGELTATTSFDLDWPWDGTWEVQ